MTADLSALIARLEAAEVGSREMDCEIGLFARTDGNGEVSDHFGTPCIRDAGGPYAPQPYTTSLDAALALAERVLPGKEWMLVKSTEGGETSFHALIGPDSLGRAGEAASAALALCIAILRAKQGEG